MRSTLHRTIAVAVLVVSALAMAAGAVRAAGSAESPADARTAIDEIRRLRVDGAALHLHLRGDDASAPVLVWLHGGPGAPERPLFRYFDAALEAHFVVAYLDQRGAGRSYDAAADPRALTVARHLADLDAVVDHLRRRLGHPRVVLLGHSWGGALGLLYAAAEPAKVAAVGAVAPLISLRDAQRSEWELVTREAARRGDDSVRGALAALGPPPYAAAAEALALERVADGYGAIYHRRPARTWIVLGGIARGLVTPWELPAFFRANEASLTAMLPELLELDLRRRIPMLAVPVVFFLGRHDGHVDARLASDYFATLDAPAKRLVWFEDSAHNPPFEEPERFVAAVVDALGAVAP